VTQLKILTIIGTRPEGIKRAPIVKELENIWIGCLALISRFGETKSPGFAPNMANWIEKL